MGLDMYLTKKHYVQNWAHNPKEQEVKITVKVGGKKHPMINTKKITYITEEAIYWRKSNQIHKWFVDTCQDGEDDCGTYMVSKEQLQKLLDLCITVRDNSILVDGIIKNGYTVNDKLEKVYNMEKGKVVKDSSIAEDLLPTESGFFFGGNDYDEYYLSDINDTIKELTAELKVAEVKGYYPEYYYHSSW